MNQITLKAYGKINMSLDVKGVMDDGYHEVEMVMQSIKAVSSSSLSSFVPVTDAFISLKPASISLAAMRIGFVVLRVLGVRFLQSAGHLRGGALPEPDVEPDVRVRDTPFVRQDIRPVDAVGGADHGLALSVQRREDVPHLALKVQSVVDDDVRPPHFAD